MVDDSIEKVRKNSGGKKCARTGDHRTINARRKSSLSLSPGTPLDFQLMSKVKSRYLKIVVL